MVFLYCLKMMGIFFWWIFLGVFFRGCINWLIIWRVSGFIIVWCGRIWMGMGIWIYLFVGLGNWFFLFFVSCCLMNLFLCKSYMILVFFKKLSFGCFIFFIFIIWGFFFFKWLIFMVLDIFYIFCIFFWRWVGLGVER